MPRTPRNVGTKPCEQCGRKMERKRFGSRLEDIGAFVRRRYCSRKCMADGMVKAGTRGVTFTRHQARKLKGKGACEDCGKPGQHVHHIDENPANNRPSNLKRLCVPCHRKAHRKAVKCKHCGAAGRIVLGFCLKHYMRFCKWGDPSKIKLNQNTALETVSD